MSIDERCWGSAFTEEQILETAAAKRLLTMELELSRECNLRCVYCYAESGRALPDELSLDEILSAADQALALGAQKIIVLGGGEPMVYPHIFDVLEHLHASGAAIELFTNATKIDARAAQELFRLGVAPVVKYNSNTAEVQDYMAGVPGIAPTIRAGLENLKAAGYPAPGKPLGAQTVICRQNLPELPALWMQLRQEDIIPYFETLTDQGRAKRNRHIHVTEDEIYELLDELARIDADHFGIHWEPKPPVAGFTCNRHLYSCTVTSVGDVIPCPGVDITVGNIRENSLQTILQQSKVIDDLRNIRTLIKGRCSRCELKAGCYGCRGAAYHVTGDYLAADPLCRRFVSDA